jgi:DNA-binding response OmpR family regulator
MARYRMRLLIIEDSADILANLLDYLTLAGYTVDSAPDGLTGLHLAATQPYDLIVLDIMLPGIDGVSLCRRLREGERSDTPVIMLTAREGLEHRLRGFAAGADDYLPKPFAMEELAARIEAVLRSREPNRRDGIAGNDRRRLLRGVLAGAC